MSKANWNMPLESYLAHQARYEIAEGVQPATMFNTTIMASGAGRQMIRVEVTVDSGSDYAVGELEDASISNAIANLRSFIAGRLGNRVKSFSVEGDASHESGDDEISYVVLVAVLDNVPREERHALREILLGMIGESTSKAVRERVAITFR